MLNPDLAAQSSSSRRPVLLIGAGPYSERPGSGKNDFDGAGNVGHHAHRG
jgi:hypothetical protein